MLRSVSEERTVKAGKLIGAVRVALTGKAHAPGIFDVITCLGRSAVVDRLSGAILMLEKKRQVFE